MADDEKQDAAPRRAAWRRQLCAGLAIPLVFVAALFGWFAVGSARHLSEGRARMACNEIGSEDASKAAMRAFVDQRGAHLQASHEFLRESGFVLRNLSSENSSHSFVYVTDQRNLPCLLLRFFSIDGTIVRLDTDRQLNIKAVH